MTTSQSAGSAAGERLKRAREAAALSLTDVASRIRLPMHVLQVLESGDWDRLGPPVFVRGQARSYARLLGVCLDDEALPSPFTTTQIPSLVSHVHVPRYRWIAENLARRAIYVVLTASLVVPVWLVTHGHGEGVPAIASLDVVPTQAMAGGESTRTPMVASIAPLPPVAAVATSAVQLTFAGDSWVTVYGADGSPVETGLVRAGERREYDAGKASRFVLGNAAGIRVSSNGRAMDLAPFSRANVARFTLSSDGSLAPSAP